MPNIIKKSEALEITRDVISLSLEKELFITVVHHPEKHIIKLTGVKHCDTIIYYFPAFQYAWNNGVRYCEMVLFYK